MSPIFETVDQFQDCEGSTGRSRVRSYQVRVKQRRSELDDYQLKQTIGQGGFGQVRKALHKITRQTVAVKICKVGHYDREQLESIQREIEVQKNLLHENIAQIYEVIRSDNKIYIFMEYCPNGQLFDRINSQGPLPERQAAKIFHQILSALIYIKKSGLSHRDIKPENVLFDEKWNVKLIDFGFGCLNNQGQFRRTVCGTPSYTAPQILKKQHYDPQLVDVWCLGVTLYATLGAQLPFDGSSPQKRKSNILNCKFRQLPTFSLKVQKLFASIFTDAQYRARLDDLQVSEFALSYEPTDSQFIDFKKESLVLEDSILKMMDSEYRMNPEKVADSVRNCKFDKYHAAYYLTIKNERASRSRHRDMEAVDKFKKEKKNSIIKLKPISRTPSVPRKKPMDDSPTQLLALKTNMLEKHGIVRMRAPKLSVDPSQCRLRRNDSPDSPRRLIDCLAAYKEY